MLHETLKVALGSSSPRFAPVSKVQRGHPRVRQGRSRARPGYCPARLVADWCGFFTPPSLPPQLPSPLPLTPRLPSSAFPPPVTAALHSPSFLLRGRGGVAGATAIPATQTQACSLFEFWPCPNGFPLAQAWLTREDLAGLSKHLAPAAR